MSVLLQQLFEVCIRIRVRISTSLERGIIDFDSTNVRPYNRPTFSAYSRRFSVFDPYHRSSPPLTLAVRLKKSMTLFAAPFPPAPRGSLLSA